MGDANHLDRRDLLRLGAGLALGAATRGLWAGPGPEPALPKRPLGSTGFQVSLLGLGGQAALEQPRNEAVALPLIERALDLGLNYLDTSARYGGEARWSEQYFGAVMKRRRKEAFLATKTHDRTADGSLRLLERSLQLLQTDHVDLWQLHAMATREDVDRVTAKGGALEAFQRAKEQKLVRFLGLSGHTDPEVLMEAIRRFPVDTVLMAFNAADPHHLSFRPLLDLAVARKMGVIAMKVPARGRLLKGFQPPAASRGAVRVERPGTLTMAEALGYVWSHPVSTAIVGVDTLAQLEENAALARAFRPLPPAELRALEARALPVSGQAQWYKRDAPQNPPRDSAPER